MPAVEQVEVTIIGAGVVGLAAAARLARGGRETVVLERHSRCGREISSRSSEVIHAGIYYPPGSLKARLCRRGHRLLAELVRRGRVAGRLTGKLLVAGSREEAERLAALAARGQENGVEGLRFLEPRELQDLEPAVAAAAALYSPATGIIDSHGLMTFFQQQARDAGAVFAFNNKVTGLEPGRDGYLVATADGSRFLSRVVVNAAGLGARRLSRRLGLATETIYYAKGCYFSCRGPAPVRRLVYPVPPADGRGLGIHATIDLAGKVKFGPDVSYVDRPDYTVEPEKRALFHRAVRRYLPSIGIERLFPDMAGIRPKLQGPDDRRFHDFIIRDEAGRGFPGFINLLGIESPGLTAAPAIAEYLDELTGPYFAGPGKQQAGPGKK